MFGFGLAYAFAENTYSSRDTVDRPAPRPTPTLPISAGFLHLPDEAID